MNMEMPSPGTGGRHRLTDTYGRNMTDAEKAYYYSLSPRDALAYDIKNVRKIYQSQGLYTQIIDSGRSIKNAHPMGSRE